MSGRDVRRFVEGLLRGRRSQPFDADEQDAAQMRTAITLRAARPGGGVPREEFVTALHRRLTAELAEGEPGDRADGRTRRHVIQGASIAAAAAAIGAVADHTLTGGGDRTPLDNPQSDATVTPTTGTWRTVAASAEVSEGEVRSFDLGSVTGFVQRSGGQVSAVSGTCTHQGCRLWWDAPVQRLRCPCHSTSFAVTGELLTHALPVAPRPLPRLAVRETDGAIEVFAPTIPA